MKTKEKLQEELIKILQSFVPNLQNDEYNKLKIELAELKEEEPKQSAEAPLNAKDIYFNLCAKYIDSMDRSDVVSMAMEEYRQLGMPTKQDACDRSNKDMEMYSDPEEMQSKMMGRKELQEAAYANGYLNCFDWLINKWKGE